jgi:hypothetical protein
MNWVISSSALTEQDDSLTCPQEDAIESFRELEDFSRDSHTKFYKIDFFPLTASQEKFNRWNP